jgi:hypothetical protein
MFNEVLRRQDKPWAKEIISLETAIGMTGFGKSRR